MCIMQKRFICQLIAALITVSLLASCSREVSNVTFSVSASNDLGAGESTSEFSAQEESFSNEHSANHPSTNSQEEEQSSVNQDVYLQAMEKWNKLGGNFDFKNIQDIDTGTLVKIYSHYFMYIGQYDLIETPDVWMDLTGFDSFVKNYFNLDPKQFHQNYSGASDNFDSEKGFKFYSHTSILPNDTKYEMVNHGDNGDGTYYFEELVTFELPEELLPKEESNIMERTTIVTFEYVEGEVYFLKATYLQNGKML